MEDPRSSSCCAKMVKSNTKSGVLSRRTETTYRPSKHTSECMSCVCLEFGLCAALELSKSRSCMHVDRWDRDGEFLLNMRTTQPHCRQLPITGLLLRQPSPPKEQSLVESAWPPSDEGAATLLDTVRERETEIRGKQLLDV